MDDLAAELVDRLRSARSLSWLRAIDAADLDAPAGEEPDADVVVAPYRWLLDRVGDGVRLTQAGYLPPVMVTSAMTELGWADDWYGKNNREDVTLPVLEVLADSTDEEHEEMLEWVGGSYDPGAFDIDSLNAALELYDRHTRQRRIRPS